MSEFMIRPVGVVKVADGPQFFIEIAEEFRPALLGLEGFSHVNVFFWCDKNDRPEARKILQMPRPYQKAPAALGVFATRSPVRPNPLSLTAAQVMTLDCDRGLLEVAYLDADEGTPIIDLKPYTPCPDRVRQAAAPDWCAHWPGWQEDSGSFDWTSEFTF